MAALSGHSLAIALAVTLFPFPTVSQDVDCGDNEEFRQCGPNCPMTCDKMDTNVCCEFKCIVGCFCKDGFVPHAGKCIPIGDCPKPGTFEFSDTSRSVLENEGLVRIKVLRLDGSKGRASVRWKAIDRTAIQGQDFTVPGGLLTMEDGQTEGYVEISVIDDTTRESDEILSLELYEPSKKANIGKNKDFVLTIIDNDKKFGVFDLSPRLTTVKESSGTVTLTILRSEGVDDEVVVSWDTVSDKLNFFPRSGEVTFRDGDSQKLLSLTIVDNDKWEPDRQLFVTLTQASNGGRIGPNPRSTIIVNDDDRKPGDLGFVKRNFVVKEGDRFARVTVGRSGGTDGSVTVHWETAERTAVGLRDFSPSSGNLKFGDGETEKTITIPITDDDLWEKDENFTVVLSDPGGGGSISKEDIAEITIFDDDQRPGRFVFHTTSLTVLENSEKVTLKVLRVGGTDGPATVKWTTEDVDAVGGRDYEHSKGVLSFASGDSEKTLDVIIDDDRVWEANEVFRVTLADPSGGTSLGTPSTLTVTIMDDDRQPGVLGFKLKQVVMSESTPAVLLHVVRVQGADGPTRVRYRTKDLTAQSGLDYVQVSGEELAFESGVTEKVIRVTLLDDSIREVDEQFEVELFDVTGGAVIGPDATATVTILDNDVHPGVLQFAFPSVTVRESDRRVTLIVSRTEGSDFEVTVRWRTVDGEARAGEDYTSATGVLVFRDGVTEQKIVIDISDDTRSEPTETLSVELFDPRGHAVLGPTRTAIVSILDDDESPSLVSFRRRSFSVKESVGQAQVPVVRRGNVRSQITIDWRAVDRSAQAGTDFVETTGLLVFQPGEERKNIAIRIIDDSSEESNELFDLVLTNPSKGAVLSTPSRFTLEILDDDEDPAKIEFKETTKIVSERDGVVRVSVVRTGGSGQSTVNYKTVDRTAVAGRDYQSATGTLLFSGGETVKVLDIIIIDNFRRNPQRFFQIQLFNPSPGNIIVDGTTTITILDDDNVAEDEGAVDPQPAPPPPRPSVEVSPALITTCPSGLILRQCASSCPPSCDSLKKGVAPCNVGGGCVRACFCPPGLVFENDQSNKCIRPENCVKNSAQIWFATSTVVVKRTDRFIRIIVRRTTSGSSTAVLWRVIDRSAVNGVDYKAPSGISKLTFLPNETEKVIDIEILGNTAKAAKSFQVEVFTPFSDTSVVNGLNVATITIEGDGRALEQEERSETELDVPEIPVRPGKPPNYIPPIVQSCPRGLIFKECVRSCPTSCEDWRLIKPCSAGGGFGCVSGCFCPQGLVLDQPNGVKCIKPSECGCPQGLVKIPCIRDCLLSCDRLECPRQLLGGLLPGILGGPTCIPGCGCPQGTILDSLTGSRCVKRSTCGGGSGLLAGLL